MSTLAIRPIEPYQVTDVKWGDYGEEASMTFKKGAVLVEDSSSKELEEWAGGTDSAIPVGIAVANASGTAATRCGYYEANDANLFSATLRNGTDAIAQAASHINGEYSLVYDSTTNSWCVDVADGTTKLVQVLRVASDATAGDTNCRVVIRFLTDKRAKSAAA